MADAVLIDDDDVVMVDDLLSKDPVVIVDEEDVTVNNKEIRSVPSVSTEETIVLDDDTSTITENETAPKVMNRETEKSFINFLENNRIMDKIVTRCTSMENATGMPRVVYKTLLPLYKDANNRFKETDAFRTLLKKTYKMLMKDPDHKFLHIKTLCEELKSGGLGRKVPFVTLSTKAIQKKDLQRLELASSSREINQNRSKNVEIRPIPEINKRNYTTPKRFGGRAKKRKGKTDRYQTRSITRTEMTDIINLDDSDSETESTDFVDSKNESTDQRNENLNTLRQGILEVPKESQKVIPVTLGEDSNKENNVTQDNLETDSNIQNQMIQATLANDYNKQNKITLLPFVKLYNLQGIVTQTTIETNSNIQNKMIQNEILTKDSESQNKVIQCEISSKHSDCQSKVIQNQTLSKDSNRQREGTQAKYKLLEDTLEENNKNEISDNDMDYDLLIPKSRLQVLSKGVMVEIEPEKTLTPNNLTKDEEIALMEKHIAFCKKCIDKLEDEEVTESNYGSQYYLCSKYKEEIVTYYKKICQLTGNSQDIVKRCEIRLQVLEGHPPGPAKRLEEFLNRSIDDLTGETAFPDFADVLKCVVESNLADNLLWNKNQIMQEAISLFRQCGQALRKRRQKREYRDLLDWVRDKEQIDDPAEKDPLLLAKLEHNKRIAKAKEEMILDSYVAMEQNPTPQHTVQLDSDIDSSDLECENEETNTETGESSRSDVNLFYPIPNNVNTSTTMYSSNHSNVGQSSNINNICVDNLVLTPTSPSATIRQNPLLYSCLLAAPTTPQFVTNMIQNQCSVQERLITDNYISNNQIDLDVLPANTRSLTPNPMSDCETIDISDNEEKIDPETELTITETTVGFNTTSDKESDMISISRYNIDNTAPTANNLSCNGNDKHNTVSSTTDGIEPNCDSSISPEGVLVKNEPLNIQSMLDELGDGVVCQVFDIEDPFLVIEISSDESTDTEEL